MQQIGGWFFDVMSTWLSIQAFNLILELMCMCMYSYACRLPRWLSRSVDCGFDRRDDFIIMTHRLNCMKLTMGFSHCLMGLYLFNKGLVFFLNLNLVKYMLNEHVFNRDISGVNFLYKTSQLIFFFICSMPFRPFKSSYI